MTDQQLSAPAAYAHARRANALAFYWAANPRGGGMSGPQRAFHEDTSRKRMVLWPNKSGKALKDDEPVATPTGWRPISELLPGDEVIAGDGTRTRVVAVHPQGVVDAYAVEFGSGDHVVCCADHLWPTRIGRERKDNGHWRNRRTADLIWYLGWIPDRKDRPVVPVAKPGQSRSETEIVGFTPIGPASCTCITVAHPDGTFLTRGHVVTHNSFSLAAEVWGLLTDSHPWDRIDHPTRIIIAVPDLDKSYADDICVAFRELEPAGILAQGCAYHPTKGYLVGGGRGILATNGTRVIFRSSHQDIRAVAGVWGARLFVNEPTAKHVWGELIRIISNTPAGRVAVLFTAAQDIRRPEGLAWMKEEVTGGKDPDVDRALPYWSAVATATGWSFHNFELREETAPITVPHRTLKSVRQQIADCPPWEYDQRILAKWDAASLDRKLMGFTQASVCDREIPEGASLGLTFDHGERPGAEVCVLVAHWTDATGNKHAHCLDEYVSTGRTNTADDARGVVAMLDRHGYTVGHISRARGDTNTAGKDSQYRRINRALEVELSALHGAPVGFRIADPFKGAGSRDYGLWVMNSAFLQGALTISPRCRLGVASCEHWRGGKSGEDGERSHWIDALRYFVYDWLDGYVRGVSLGAMKAAATGTKPDAFAGTIGAMGDFGGDEMLGSRGGF